MVPRPGPGLSLLGVSGEYGNMIRLYGDNGKEDGNYYIILGHIHVYIHIYIYIRGYSSESGNVVCRVFCRAYIFPSSPSNQE